MCGWIYSRHFLPLFLSPPYFDIFFLPFRDHEPYYYSTRDEEYKYAIFPKENRSEIDVKNSDREYIVSPSKFKIKSTKGKKKTYLSTGSLNFSRPHKSDFLFIPLLERIFSVIKM